MNKRPIIPYHKLPKRLSVLPKEEAISDTVSTRDYSDLFVYFRFAIIPFYVTTFVSIIIFLLLLWYLVSGAPRLLTDNLLPYQVYLLDGWLERFHDYFAILDPILS